MSRSKLFFYLFFVSYATVANAQKEITVNYFTPYQYRKENSRNIVKAWLPAKDLPGDLSISLDGSELTFFRTDTGTVELYLPLAGKTSELEFYSGKNSAKLISRQLFKPLVPAEWGYFGKGTIHIICSSHQDIAWMNTPDTCRKERIHEIIIPALDLIDKNPGFRFEMEQTLNLMEVLDEVPSEKQRISTAFNNGQFSWGATFNQPYEGLESGEQLVRQTYLGRKWIKDNLPGMDALAAYNIDVPGRSLQFPQMLQKSGIKYLVISRMKEGFYNWYSPDGSKILTYSPGNYGWSLLVYRYFEDDAITALQKLNKVLKNWDEYYSSRNIPPNYSIIISTDAGGPKDYSNVINEWNDIARSSGYDIPLVQHSTAEEFLEKIDVPGAKFDSISGERPDLWLYIHGPAHYEAIKAKKSAAVSLPAAEAFSSVIALVNGNLKSYPEELIEKGWYKSIYPDHGWGGKNGEITDSIFRASLEEGNAIGNDVLKESLEDISSKVDLKNSGNILVYNDLSWKRKDMTTIDISRMKGTDWIVADAATGKSVPSQIVVNNKDKSISFIAEDVPSIGYKTYFLKRGNPSADNKIKVSANFYENEFYSAELGPGGITRLFDKETDQLIFNTSKFSGGDLLSLGYSGNGAGEFVQVTPTNMDEYLTTSMQNASWTVRINGPVFASFESSCRMRNFTVKQIITFYHHLKRIDFEYDIPDWPGEHNRQLRVAFPMNMTSSEITYDVPMGVVTVGKDELNISPGGWAWGGTYRQLPEEINPREIENFISANNNKIGVTVSSDLAVADWIDPTRESAGYPVLQAILLSSHKSCHAEGNWYHQEGNHHFRLTLTSHKPGWKEGYHFGVEGNHPLRTIVKEKSQRGTLPSELSFVSVSSPFVRITALKKGDDDKSLIIRMIEMEGADKEINLNFFRPVKNLIRTNIIEEDADSTGIDQMENLRIRRNSIETYRLEF